MKLTHHRDGTWSLTGLTCAEVQALALAAGTASIDDLFISSGRATKQVGAFADTSTAGRAYHLRKFRALNAFSDAVHQATQYGGGGLAAGKATTTVPSPADHDWPGEEEAAAELAAWDQEQRR